VISIEGSYATGVSAPDGVAETWYQRAIQCRECGCLEEIE
jgi:hypothetical protein